MNEIKWRNHICLSRYKVKTWLDNFKNVLRDIYSTDILKHEYHEWYIKEKTIEMIETFKKELKQAINDDRFGDCGLLSAKLWALKWLAETDIADEINVDVWLEKFTDRLLERYLLKQKEKADSWLDKLRVKLVTEYLKREFQKHVDKEDWIDCGVYSAMLWALNWFWDDDSQGERMQTYRMFGK